MFNVKKSSIYKHLINKGHVDSYLLPDDHHFEHLGAHPFMNLFMHVHIHIHAGVCANIQTRACGIIPNMALPHASQ